MHFDTAPVYGRQNCTPTLNHACDSVAGGGATAACWVACACTHARCTPLARGQQVVVHAADAVRRGPVPGLRRVLRHAYVPGQTRRSRPWRVQGLPGRVPGRAVAAPQDPGSLQGVPDARPSPRRKPRYAPPAGFGCSAACPPWPNHTALVTPPCSESPLCSVFPRAVAQGWWCFRGLLHRGGHRSRSFARAPQALWPPPSHSPHRGGRPSHRIAPYRSPCLCVHVCGAASQGVPPPFFGCFKNDGGSQWLSVHAKDKSLSDCEQAAEAAGKPLFGMEYPQQSSTPGHAHCLLLDALPQQNKTADSECAKERDGAGNLLGDANRLAVYPTQPGVWRAAGATFHDAWPHVLFLSCLVLVSVLFPHPENARTRVLLCARMCGGGSGGGVCGGGRYKNVQPFRLPLQGLSAYTKITARARRAGDRRAANRVRGLPRRNTVEKGNTGYNWQVVHRVSNRKCCPLPAVFVVDYSC